MIFVVIIIVVVVLVLFALFDTWFHVDQAGLKAPTYPRITLIDPPASTSQQVWTTRSGSA